MEQEEPKTDNIDIHELEQLQTAPQPYIPYPGLDPDILSRLVIIDVPLEMKFIETVEQAPMPCLESTRKRNTELENLRSSCIRQAVSTTLSTSQQEDDDDIPELEQPQIAPEPLHEPHPKLNTLMHGEGVTGMSYMMYLPHPAKGKTDNHEIPMETIFTPPPPLYKVKITESGNYLSSLNHDDTHLSPKLNVLTMGEGHEDRDGQFIPSNSPAKRRASIEEKKVKTPTLREIHEMNEVYLSSSNHMLLCMHTQEYEESEESEENIDDYRIPDLEGY